jgi:hypothetical protein
MADLPVGGFAVNESVGWLEPGMLTRHTMYLTAYCRVTDAHANLVLLLLGTVFAAPASSRSAKVSSRRGGTLRMRSLSLSRSSDLNEVRA